MIDANIFTTDTSLSDNDVAVVFSKSGGIRIAYNSERVRETGLIDYEDAPNFLMALAVVILMNDEDAMTKAMASAAHDLALMEVPEPGARIN